MFQMTNASDTQVLNDTLSVHSLGNLNETSDVGTCNEVVLITGVFFSCRRSSLVDALHDLLELRINFFEGPFKTL